MSMTIKQLADSIGVSKTAIRKRIDDSFRDSYTAFNNAGMILISDEGCKLLMDGFRKQAETKEKFAETKNKFAETKEETWESKEKFPETKDESAETREKFPQTMDEFPQTGEKFAETKSEFPETGERLMETEEKFPETSGNQAETSANRISARMVDMLQEQLNVKDRQIAELNARLAETTLALTETQRSLQAAQALHAGTIQQSLETAAEQYPYTESDTAVSAEGSEKRGFFSRFAGVFNRKR